ncbi:hypothetical protein [Nostoc sp. UIC 10630]|uniref:hypothetical protein n=1 Tax=Nostoc sp. UIC 10630 TaxID=2100146 RepID=UPI0013CF9756|nr:hypothetical protein [Nostoc sp. UIC 10630]NEU79998.1 hypothetical protein [Nostoc sp. UIC 10630]
MFNLRQANLQNLEALIQLRLELLREAGNIKGDSQYFSVKGERGKGKGLNLPLPQTQ